MYKFLMIFLLAGFMSGCSQEEVNPVEIATEQSYVKEKPCEDCEGGASGERDLPGNVASPDEIKSQRSKERGITI